MWPDTQTLSSSYSNFKIVYIGTDGTSTSSFSGFTTFDSTSCLEVTHYSGGIFNPYRGIIYKDQLNFDNINYISFSAGATNNSLSRWTIKISTRSMANVYYGTTYDENLNNGVSLNYYNDYGYCYIDKGTTSLISLLFDVSAASGTRYLTLYCQYNPSALNINTSDNKYWVYFANIKTYYSEPFDSFDYSATFSPS